MLQDIIQPCTILGALRGSVGRETGARSMPVIAVAGHDTASAVASVPAEGDDYAYLSSGTWSLMGLETRTPAVTEWTFDHNFTNEGGVAGTTRLLKNIMGLWIEQEMRRAWQKEGEDVSFEQLEDEIRRAPAFPCFIDPDDSSFYAPGDMPAKIAAYLQRTGQHVPPTQGGMARCVLESLAMKYRLVFRELEQLAGRRLGRLHIVGGGCRNRLLNQFTADSLGRPVLAGPAEATAIGNIMCQLMALGEVHGLVEAREIVRASCGIETWEPRQTADWDVAFEVFLEAIGRQRG